MLFATTIGIFFIPLFFRVIRGLAERSGARQPRGRRRAAAVAGVAGGPMIRASRRSLARRRSRPAARSGPATTRSRWSRAATQGGRGARRATARARSSIRWRRPGRSDTLRRRRRPPARADAAAARLAREPRVARHLPRLHAGRAGAHGAGPESRSPDRGGADPRVPRARWASPRRRCFPTLTANGSVEHQPGRDRRVPADLVRRVPGHRRRGVGARFLGPDPARRRGGAAPISPRRRRRSARWCCRS